MNQAILLFVIALSVSSAFPSGRLDRTKNDGPVFPVKKAFEKFQLYADELSAQEHPINNNYLPKDDMSSEEDFIAHLNVPSRLYLKKPISQVIWPKDLESMTKEIPRRLTSPWKIYDNTDNFLLNFRSISGVLSAGTEVNRIFLYYEIVEEDVSSSAAPVERFPTEGIIKNVLYFLLYYTMIHL